MADTAMLERAASRAGVALRHDARFDAAAGELVCLLASAGDAYLPRSAQSAALWRAGIADTDTALLAWELTPGHEPEELSAKLREVARSSPLRSPLAGGTGRCRASDSEWLVVLVALRHAEQHAGGPTSASRGDVARLDATLADGLREPELVLTRPDGSVESKRLDAPRATARIPLDARGRWMIELAATGPLGPLPVLNYPVDVDVAPPPPERARAPEDSEALVREGLLAELNRTRTARGLRALAHDDTVAKTARAHCADMEANGFRAHVSPRTGDAGDRLRRAGREPASWAENIGGGLDARDIHSGLMESPGHRGAILSPWATHVGIGLVRSDTSPFLWCATEVFVATPAPLDARSPDEAWRVVERARRSNGLRALARDARLEKLAKEAAHRATGARVDSKRGVEEARALVENAVLPWEHYELLAVEIASFDALATKEVASHRHARAAGLALAQATGPDRGILALAIVAW